ncbi:hypothetical protein QWY93_03855 [Echinicola jeungdonensis]|uniref:Transcriptional regulator n=1 Tax=Echinicola jeungdonensis TaxID=709343 RepID=A0ABV5J1D6_9BACT|nr:hypothetical protein [Echinicola jeungdonensis]MDN3668460.1 hypothetical protein [Echinicola jeungdonensis]
MKNKVIELFKNNPNYRNVGLPLNDSNLTKYENELNELIDLGYIEIVNLTRSKAYKLTKLGRNAYNLKRPLKPFS